ncbi:MAG: hypothetical protein P4L58_01415, partial [Candidatus Pacebacteria bacterium]|nr:hypothetical protein [Candidatus Paceibacterota bacterium]
MIEILKRYYPSFSRIEESEITYGGNSLGWHSTLFDSSSQIGSGCSQNKDSARRIATSEAIERGVFRELLKKEPKSFLLDEFPTTSGFAAGFEPAHVKHRAIAEAVERWAWSKWIDQDCLVEAASPGTREIGPLGSFFQGKFDEVLFFKKNFKIFAE